MTQKRSAKTFIYRDDVVPSERNATVADIMMRVDISPYALVAICPVRRNKRPHLEVVCIGHQLGNMFNKAETGTLAYVPYSLSYEHDWYIKGADIYCDLIDYECDMYGEEYEARRTLAYKLIQPKDILPFQRLLLTKKSLKAVTTVQWSQYTVPLKEAVTKDGKYIWDII